MEENKLQIVDKFTISEFLTFVSKGQSWEADGGNHDDLVMSLVLFSWFITTPFFTSLTDLELKKLLYEEQQKQIEDDIVPAGIFSKPENEAEVYVEGGDVWTVVENTKVY